jgi:hypothetical protein
VDLSSVRRGPGAHLFHIADGRVTRLALYFGDRDRAFADVGLAPETRSPDS